MFLLITFWSWKRDITVIKHPSHRHSLVLQPPGAPYLCHECKELGFGARYRCSYKYSKFVIHDICANLSEFGTHPFRKSCKFEFHKEDSGFSGCYCAACGHDVRGFAYRCTSHSQTHPHYLHPCCLKLHPIIRTPHMTLELTEKLHSKCLKCRQKKVSQEVRGWGYVSTCRQYHYHVSCVKEMVLENWKKDYFSLAKFGEIQRVFNGDDPPVEEIVRGGSTTSTGSNKKLNSAAVFALKLIVSAIFGESITLISNALEALVTN